MMKYFDAAEKIHAGADANQKIGNLNKTYLKYRPEDDMSKTFLFFKSMKSFVHFNFYWRFVMNTRCLFLEVRVHSKVDF